MTDLNNKKNFVNLCESFGIDVNLDSCEFVKAVDMKRKEYKITQEVFCDMVGISRSFYSQCKSGKKTASAVTQLNMVWELNKVRELSEIEENAARFNVCKNVVQGNDKFSIEKVTALQQQKELKEKLWQVIGAKQKIKRNSKAFNPSIEPSIDKVTLFVKLTAYTESIFMKTMENFGVVSGNTKYINNARYKYGKVTEYQHVWMYEGSDCKVHVQYVYFDKKTASDVRELKVEFNPNKWVVEENEMLVALMPFLSNNPRLKEFDVCKDHIGYKDTSVILPKSLFDEDSSPVKVFSEFGARTLYFGDKNKTINLMVYDKRKEIKAKDQKDIGYDCLRLESRYKLKPSEWKGKDDNKRFVEYRVKLSDVGEIPLPHKTYSCQAHMVEPCDLDSLDITVEDNLVITAILRGALSLYDIYKQDRETAVKFNSILTKLAIENMSISRTDVIVALNTFVFKYLDNISKYFEVENVKAGVEMWKFKQNIPEGFEFIGSYDWESEEFSDLDVNRGNKDILLSRDMKF